MFNIWWLGMHVRCTQLRPKRGSFWAMHIVHVLWMCVLSCSVTDCSCRLQYYDTCHVQYTHIIVVLIVLFAPEYCIEGWISVTVWSIQTYRHGYWLWQDRKATKWVHWNWILIGFFLYLSLLSSSLAIIRERSSPTLVAVQDRGNSVWGWADLGDS